MELYTYIIIPLQTVPILTLSYCLFLWLGWGDRMAFYLEWPWLLTVGYTIGGGCTFPSSLYRSLYLYLHLSFPHFLSHFLCFFCLLPVCCHLLIIFHFIFSCVFFCRHILRILFSLCTLFCYSYKFSQKFSSSSFLTDYILPPFLIFLTPQLNSSSSLCPFLPLIFVFFPCHLFILIFSPYKCYLFSGHLFSLNSTFIFSLSFFLLE